MSLGYTTIVTRVASDRVQALDSCLRTVVRPEYDPQSIIKCRQLFRFDKIKGLHLCSILILLGLDQSERAYLVFEATFDGSKDEFLDDLLRVAPKGIHAIYKNCDDYPESGVQVPELVKEYLARHDVGAQTFYSGSPGRSVAQINGEAHIQQQLLSFVGDRRKKVNPPTTHLDLQRELKDEVRRKNQWAEQPAVVPWEVTHRTLIAFLAGLSFFAVACGVGTVALLLGAPDVSHKWIAAFVDETYAPILWVGVWLVVWLILRWVQLFWLDDEDPRARGFWTSYAGLGLFVLRYYALAVLIVGLALLPRALPTLIAICVLVTLAAIWLLLQARAISLKLLIQLRELCPKRELWRRYTLDVVGFLLAVVAGSTFFVLGSYIPGVMRTLGSVALWLLVPSFYGVLTLYAIGLALFLVVRGLELADRRRFASATELATKETKPSAYEREEGGVNRYQNHLASLTYVKPGLLRTGLLRLTLFAIKLLSRFWFNQGRLGGIPTILAARWVLIKGAEGRPCLLFLTNYGGAWDSYLNEFIDMGAVIGLNAVWSNTFIKLNDTECKFAFPETAFYLWRGAEAEKPFKAYVRHSQIETIVWYSAYPKLSILNINSNTELRQALFSPLAPWQLDSVFHKAGL